MVFFSKAGYRFYKKQPNITTIAKQIDTIAIVLFGIDYVLLAFLMPFFLVFQVPVYLVFNIILVILLSMQRIRDELSP
jgi:uncharacterized paraquat-inducible protein A